MEAVVSIHDQALVNQLVDTPIDIGELDLDESRLRIIGNPPGSGASQEHHRTIIAQVQGPRRDPML
jgi:hypothetical protein